MMGPTRVRGYKHAIVPFVARKNGKLFDCQQSYTVLVLRVPGLEEGVKHCDRWPEHSFGCWARRVRPGQTYPHRSASLEVLVGAGGWGWESQPVLPSLG